MVEGSFATVINCMDGRTQLPVNEYLREKYGVDYVDTITEPGPIKYLADGTDKAVIDSIRNRVAISIEKHGSGAIGIVGHFGCAGNPVSKEMQLEQLELAVKVVRSWGFDVDVIKLWVDENWTVHEV